MTSVKFCNFGRWSHFFILNFVVFMSGWCYSAGQEKGGGHTFESKFRFAAIKVATEITNIPTIHQRQLRFDPNNLLVSANQMGVGCAEPDSAERSELLSLGKLALFIGYDKNKIFLLCEKEDHEYLKILAIDSRIDKESPVKKSAKKWLEILPYIYREESLSIANKIFMIHEILRTQKLEESANEDNYQVSSSIIPAYSNWANEKTKIAMAMLLRKKNQNSCKLNLNSFLDQPDYYEVKVQLDDQLLFVEKINQRIISTQDLIAKLKLYPQIIDRPREYGENLVLKIMAALETAQCFE